MSTKVQMAGTEIEELKRVVGATTDQDLAAFLGVERSTVAQWKRRGAVPQKYQFLYKSKSDKEVREAVLNANRHHLFGHTSHHYWMAAALAVVPGELFSVQGGSDAEIGQARERALVKLMGLAMTITMTDLKKRRCESEADYLALVEALSTTHAAAVASVIASARRGE